ncbi:cytokine-dependent hematopoietic cell linker [Pteropus vampyrus]|uniref:Cytokine-dependent hematopoietic cell linker n=1 Tax=Pteropus vampyrus TaxID=132908 RepID=A0A6P6CXZ8_PTEVA|nr:cytokine-dependent hematopoietic cell linker [Pteropus vampyrus]
MDRMTSRGVDDEVHTLSAQFRDRALAPSRCKRWPRGEIATQESGTGLRVSPAVWTQVYLRDLERGNRRTTKEGPSDLKFQNFSLPKNRSWPHINSGTGQHQTINEPLLECERNFAAVLDRATDSRDDGYEDLKLHMAEAWPSMKILPARPIRESEYADTRYFQAMGDTPLCLDAKTSVPTEGPPWNKWTRLGEVDKPISKDVGSQRVKGDKPPKGSKTPLPPPRLPPVTLPKRYQPLPPEPESSRWTPPQRHTFPEVQRGLRQISLKNLSEVLGTEKAPHHRMKPESSHLSQNQSAPGIPLAIASSSFMTNNHGMQNRDHKESTQSLPPPACQSPASYSPKENSLCYKNMSWRKPFPTRSDEKDIRHSEWYIGECSRQAVEEALMKESKDGTFLVRDCSTRSRAEPYVLVVFYGSKVYNVKIRFLERNQQFALGTGLRGDEKFDSVEDIIEHYKYFPIVLIDGKDKSGIHREQCYLTRPLPLRKHFSPG